jgi:hypothetical protein
MAECRGYVYAHFAATCWAPLNGNFGVGFRWIWESCQWSLNLVGNACFKDGFNLARVIILQKIIIALAWSKMIINY